MWYMWVFSLTKYYFVNTASKTAHPAHIGAVTHRNENSVQHKQLGSSWEKSFFYPSNFKYKAVPKYSTIRRLGHRIDKKWLAYFLFIAPMLYNMCCGCLFFWRKRNNWNRMDDKKLHSAQLYLASLTGYVSGEKQEFIQCLYYATLLQNSITRST